MTTYILQDLNGVHLGYYPDDFQLIKAISALLNGDEPISFTVIIEIVTANHE